MKPVILVILDGYGMSPISEGNAIALAKTPFLDWAITQAPKALLHASGSEVGLDWGEMGNSEVGHLNIGTGRIIMQDLPRINKTIEDGSFFQNSALIEAASRVKKNDGKLHIVGLASTGGVHAHLKHMLALLEFAKTAKINRVILHLISDGRDTPPETMIKDLPHILETLKQVPGAKIGSISGRYFAMDRDKRWDRIQLAYQAMAAGNGRRAQSPVNALDQAKAAHESDEFITPTVIVDESNKPIGTIDKQDVVIFTNFRPDRARQLSAAFVQKDFQEFPRPLGPVNFFVSFTSYGQEPSADVKVAFFAPEMKHQLAAIVSAAGVNQFHIAETEKYAHVTYFLNGGMEKPFAKEERLLVPSPKVTTYDLKPAMSAKEITRGLLKRLSKDPPALSVVNFANPDMVGHTGNLKAAVEAIQIVDAQLAEIRPAASKIGATCIITADHGNAEQLVNPETHTIDKEHTTNPVPCFILPPELAYQESGADEQRTDLISFAAQPAVGVLADIAPTVLDLLELEQPVEMTGQSLKGLV